MKKRNNERLVIDGRPVRKFFFARKSPISGHPIYVEVEAFDKDHAINRLRDKFHWVERREWEFISELDPEHFIGVLGESLPLIPVGAVLAPGSRRAQ